MNIENKIKTSIEQEKLENELSHKKYELENLNEEKAKENKQLKDNWNKLKEYIRETKLKEFEKSYGKRYGRAFTQAEIVVCNMILDEMQELEGSDSNEKI